MISTEIHDKVFPHKFLVLCDHSPRVIDLEAALHQGLHCFTPGSVYMLQQLHTTCHIQLQRGSILYGYTKPSL